MVGVNANGSGLATTGGMNEEAEEDGEKRGGIGQAVTAVANFAAAGLRRTMQRDRWTACGAVAAVTAKAAQVDVVEERVNMIIEKSDQQKYVLVS